MTGDRWGTAVVRRWSGPFKSGQYLCALLGALLALSSSAQQESLAAAALIDALRGGGYNIYFRHASTDWSQGDRIRSPADWESCDPSQVRQLSDAGRADARRVGEAMRALQIPVGRVLASPYCRTVETADLMDVGEVEASTDIINMRAAKFVGGRDAVVRSARALLATEPEPGTNTVLVAHGNVATAATPVYPGEGEGVIFEPDGDGGFEFVGRLTPSQWAELAGAAELVSD